MSELIFQQSVDLPWLTDIDYDHNALHLTLRNGQKHTIEAASLFDNRSSILSPISHQRILASNSLRFEAPCSIGVTPMGLDIGFTSCGTEHFSYDFIFEKWLRPDLLPEPYPWDADLALDHEVYAYAAFMAEAEIVLAALSSFLRNGYVCLRAAPCQSDEVEKAIARFGYVRETNYGRVFDVRTKPKMTNLADSTLKLEPHTDNPYRHPSPSIQILHALQSSKAGGDTLIVDGLKVIQALKQQFPDYYDSLSNQSVRFQWTDGDHILSHSAPLITAKGSEVSIRFNHRAMIEVEAHGAQASLWREAYDQLSQMINQDRFTHHLRLDSGDMILMDNHRLLHGRSGFDGDEGERWLQGAYAEKDALKSKVSILMMNRIETAYNDIAALFLSDAAQQNYGEAISIAQHMLQTADWLVRNEAGDALVIAGLLHDIGWLLPQSEHALSGAQFLNPLLGPEVSEPIRLHVLAKRWMVTTDPTYLDILSLESKRTLEKQGGALTPEACQEFENNPYFHQAVKLRIADDQAKLVDAAPPSFSAYSPIIRTLILDQFKRSPA